MIKVNIHDAKTHLSSYLERVEQGEKVVICRRNVPVAEIHGLSQQEATKPRPLGLARKKYGDFSLPKSFFEPLPEDLLSTFEGR